MVVGFHEWANWICSAILIVAAFISGRTTTRQTKRWKAQHRKAMELSEWELRLTLREHGLDPDAILRDVDTLDDGPGSA